ncbi:nucleotidyltransferase substrate binding protein [Marinitoga litoralis]|uniref:nucleotidyltransferase substrate binding protein n=1 Tax=Marinitoga litoralis TaxID=570855 RepID=UPI001961A1CB|nr:nucleotidyltransferase substrate binding protein [Marinitoga litoralis]MBM7559022.1 nucleotidyltransferase substrate binding protein (TIGR01987 family) [Marinitoga litoralis]
MNKKDIRWKQRFQNFEKSYKLLKKYINMEDMDELDRAGIIQFFEMSFELSWKVLKDFLEYNGYLVKSPREAIKLAFQLEIIDNGEYWLKALEDRNLTVHTYDENTAMEIVKKIKGIYLPELDKFYENMLKELKK